MVGLVATIEEETGATVDELNLGGGLGVRYLADDAAPTIAAYSATVRDACDKALADAGVRSRPRLMTEPGRSIVAPAGLTLYRVGTIKEIPGVLPARATAPRPFTVTVAGKHCEQGDLLVRDAQLPADVAIDDILAVPVTGGYGQAMASNYNKVLRPAVVFVRDGDARVVVRRETDADLVRLDTDG